MASSTKIPALFIILIITFFPIFTHSLPFVVFHGAVDQCNLKGAQRFVDNLSKWSNSQGHCIEIGDGMMDSWFMTLSEQTQIACEKVKSMSELRDGYNILGLSQGNMVGRGVVELCDGGPPVKNFISVSGPHAGIASMPFCSGAFCVIVDSLLQSAVYSDYVQKHLGPADYVKIPTALDEYEKGCKFLPKINNEFTKNSTYKERFSSLENLVLIMCEKDTILVPKETSWFGYHPDGAWEPMLRVQETKLYIEDWIGLKTMVEAGKVKFVKLPGGHAEVSDDEMKQYIVPYLKDRGASSSRKEDPQSHACPSSVWSFIKNLIGLAGDEKGSCN